MIIVQQLQSQNKCQHDGYKFTEVASTASLVGFLAFATFLNHETAKESLNSFLFIRSTTASIDSPLLAAIRASMKTFLM